MPRTIFMIHGMYCGSWVWEKYVPFFEERGWRCITTTLRHHDMAPNGKPAPELATTSLLDYAADLEAEIRSLEDRPVIMGHSMGGLLAQILSARGLGRAAVLLTPAAPAGALALAPSVIRCFSNVLTTWAFWKKSFRPTFESAEWAFLEGFPVEERRGIWERQVYESGRAIFEIGLWAMDRRHAARVDPASVTDPLLVVAAGQDRATPAAVVRKVAKRYGSYATYHEFEEQAHWVLAQKGWEEVAGFVENWLQS
ncbi:MAG: alpha/beta hydrolase [Thermoanaerobaculales bacterium]|nr:alpha/beta hydrolase [Thermoanaerobaculales bacterium]